MHTQQSKLPQINYDHFSPLCVSDGPGFNGHFKIQPWIQNSTDSALIIGLFLCPVSAPAQRGFIIQWNAHSMPQKINEWVLPKCPFSFYLTIGSESELVSWEPAIRRDTRPKIRMWQLTFYLSIVNISFKNQNKNHMCFLHLNENFSEEGNEGNSDSPTPEECSYSHKQHTLKCMFI